VVSTGVAFGRRGSVGSASPRYALRYAVRPATLRHSRGRLRTKRCPQPETFANGRERSSTLPLQQLYFDGRRLLLARRAFGCPTLRLAMAEERADVIEEIAGSDWLRGGYVELVARLEYSRATEWRASWPTQT
jgi:hypothetical protein